MLTQPRSRVHTAKNGNQLQLLEQLVEKENTLQDVCLAGKKLRVKLDWTLGMAVISNRRTAYAQLNRPFLHKIANWAFPHLKAELETKAADFHQNQQWWRQKITPEVVRRVLTRDDVMVRLLPIGDDYQVYGLVSRDYRQTNQLTIRSNFIATMQQQCKVPLVSKGIEKVDRFGRPVECFLIGGFQNFGVRLALHYGLDNGYSAYIVSYEREVLVCTNGLTEWKADKRLKWFHNSQFSFIDFVTMAVQGAYWQGDFLNRRLESARQTPLTSDNLMNLIVRLNAAAASRTRVLARLDKEIADCGKTDWALSQSLTWLATHEKALPFRCQEYFRQVGTDILERSLAKTLSAGRQRQDALGVYSTALLPGEQAWKHHNKSRQAKKFEQACQVILRAF